MFIHVNKGSGRHELLTEDQFREKYGELPNSNPSELAIQLREKRKQSRITIRLMADTMKVRASYICDVEHGRTVITPEFAAEWQAAIDFIDNK